jgi:hypothetical protein
MQWEWNSFGIVMFAAGIGFALVILTEKIILPSIFAATAPWTQTNWDGGVAGGTVTSTVTTYESQTDIDTTIAGELSLDVTSSWSGDYANWSYRKQITFDNTTASLGTTSEALVNFPVLVKLDTGTDIDYSKTKNAGEDIRFTDSDGIVLSYEIEKWDESGSSYVWVKVPQININSNTDHIYMYYGNAAATDGQNASDVWDSNFKMVHHFNSDYADSSNYSNDGVNSGASFNTGKIAGGVYGNANNTSITVADNVNWEPGSSGFTIEFWAKHASTFSGTYSIPWDAYSGGKGFHVGLMNDRKAYVYINGGSPWVRNQGTAVSDVTQWHKYTYVYTPNTSVVFYVDGVQFYSTSAGIAASVSAVVRDLKLFGGYYVGNGYTFKGDLDENRLSLTPRSAAWVAAIYKSESDAFNTYESEQSKYAAAATLTSNILNAEYAADWGVLTYTTSGSGTVTVKVRSDSNADMSTAPAWGSCGGISSGTDLSGTACVTDTDQYLQYQITLQPSGGSTPVFESISMAFTASDAIPPSTNATSLDITSLADTDTWTNSEPTITFTAGADDGAGNGLAGYCIALDEVTVTGSETSNALNPETTAGSLLNALDDGISNLSTCPYILGPGNVTSIDLSTISGLTLTTGKRYYLSIKAVDLAGNVYTGVSNTYQDLVDFKYDSTAPTNVSYISAPSIVFGNVVDMNFSWPSSGGSISSDSDSGVLGWQYSLDSGSTWRGPDTESTLGITYIDDDSSTYSYTLTEGDDGLDISEGINTVYLRTVDRAGNYSSPSTYRTAPLNYGGAAPTFAVACDLTSGITITPSSSTSNSYALSWGAATATGVNTVSTYYYMINTSPPSTLSSLRSNSTQYIPVSSGTAVSTKTLTGAVKGTNTVYVVAIDNENNYSQSNCLKGTFTLNSTLPDPARSLSASDASIKSDELWRASITWGVPVYKGTGTLTYIIQRSTDNATWTQVTTTTGTSYTDTVSTSATYYYRVGTYDTTSESITTPTYSTSVSVYPKGTWDAAPTLSSGPTVTGITTKRATINWSTSRTADSRVQYGTGSGSYFDEEPSKSDKVTSHEIKLLNLSPGTKYYYRVKWTDEDGNTGISTEKTFTTDPAPVVSAVEASEIGLNSAFINFTVSNAKKVTIQYGPSTAYGGTTSITTASEGRYSVRLGDLLDDTAYHYRIVMEDAEGDTYESDDYTDLVTLPRPRISNIEIEEVQGTAQPTVLVSWSTNTEVSSIITYYPTGNTGDARDEVSVTLKSGVHRMVLRGLQNETRYSMQVKGRDKVGNEAVSDIQTFTTATDTRPPQIENLRVEGSTSVVSTGANQQAYAQLVISWDTDEPSTSQVEIGEGTGTTYAQRSQEDRNMTTNHIVILSNLTPSKVYHLRAISKDIGGNIGYSLDTVTITPKSTDSALDLVIGNLSEVFGFLRGL